MRNALTVGATIVVSTPDGEEEDEVTRVIVDAVDAGVCVVETARNGRVIVMRGIRQPRFALQPRKGQTGA
ncbi:MAG TPA: hypothetical protein VGJ18_03970 [Gemmatimonadaceae bacterium]